MVMLSLEEQPPLIQAIFCGEIEDVRNVLNSKVDVNYQDVHKRSPLHAAAFKGDKILAELLLSLGARVNAKDSMWLTPLHRACCVGAYEVVNLLLEYKADINARDRQWQTPLHLAAANNALECVEILLDHVPNVNVTDRLGKTALHHAALNGHNDVAEFLIAKGCIVNACDKKDCRPIHWAAYMGNVETTGLLILHGADVNVKDRNQYTPLHVAAATGMTMVGRVLLNAGAEVDAPNAFGNTPLHVACLNGHLPVCRDLLYYNANLEAVNYRGQAPLHIAAASAHGVGCLNFLLDNNVNINKQSLDGRTALHMSAIHGRFTRSKTLIDKGAIVDCHDKNGNTALHISAQYGHDILTSTLLEYGADPNKRGYEGRTPLHVCCLSGYVEVSRKFIQTKIDLNTTDDTGKTATHCAAYAGSVECLDLLVSQGAKFKLPDNIGRTALHYAAVRGHYDCVFTLVGIGSPVNVVDNEGCSALHLSAAYDMEGKCVEYLLRHKADPMLKDKNGFTPIHYAVNGCNIKALEYLLFTLDKNLTFYGPGMPATTPLHLAARSGNMEILETIRPYFPDMNIKNDTGATPLLLAAREGHTPSVQMFLRYGAKAGICEDIYNMSPVHYSAKNGHIQCLALIVDNIEDKTIIDKPDKFNRTALMLAVSGSHGACVLILLKANADPNIIDNDGHSSIFRAVATDQKNVLQLLISQNAKLTLKDINGKSVLHLVSACGYLSCLQIILNNLKAEEAVVFDNKDFTPLHWGCYFGNVACVEYLLDSNIFTSIEGNLFSPVHCAAFAGSERCLELLYNKFGSEIVKLLDIKKRLSLHIAALQGHIECARYLLEQGADINAEDETGRTALVAAAQNGQSQIIELLIAYKADVKSSDNNGNTALHVACLKRHSHTALLLLEYINKEEIINMVNNDKKTALHLAARNGLVDVTKNLIKKGSSVLAVDANGFTPALCCAPNQYVAQCLALILANHPLQYATNHSNKEPCESRNIPVISTSSSFTQTDGLLTRGFEALNRPNMKLPHYEHLINIESWRNSHQNQSSKSNDISTMFKPTRTEENSSDIKITFIEDRNFDESYEPKACVKSFGLDLHRSASEIMLQPNVNKEKKEKTIISWKSLSDNITIKTGAISKKHSIDEQDIKFLKQSKLVPNYLEQINILPDPKILTKHLIKNCEEVFKILKNKVQSNKFENLNFESSSLYLPLNEAGSLTRWKNMCDCEYVCEKCIIKNMFDADFNYETDKGALGNINTKTMQITELTIQKSEMFMYRLCQPKIIRIPLILESKVENSQIEAESVDNNLSMHEQKIFEDGEVEIKNKDTKIDNEIITCDIQEGDYKSCLAKNANEQESSLIENVITNTDTNEIENTEALIRPDYEKTTDKLRAKSNSKIKKLKIEETKCLIS